MSISPDEIDLTAEQKQRLAEIADQAGKPWGEVLAEALEAYRSLRQAAGANGGESFYDAAFRLGLIGCVAGGPPPT
jgi:Spy/CpxP family protein refolding chaperone